MAQVNIGVSDTHTDPLTGEILSGTYKPSLISDCAISLPLDLNPHSIRFIQPFLLVDPSGKAASTQYLIVQPKRIDRAQLEKLNDALATDLLKDSRKRSKSRSSEDQGRALLSILKPLESAGLISISSLSPKSQDPKDVVKSAIMESIAPSSDFLALDNPHPHVGLCLIFDQVWEHKGYTRGELINSISLAPGEQLTLEFHSWDKSTVKTEDELAIESEMRSSQTLTERDSSSVTKEMSKKIGGKIGATFPIKAVMVNAEMSGEYTDSSKRTVEHTNERTVESSNSLKNTRKIRIETSREVGREHKQTRVISNTNRCHTLNCLYFEIMSNYIVTTKFVAVQPCLLIPNPKIEINPATVLCYEDILKEALLSRTFLPGFDAARILETHRVFQEQIPPRGGSTGTIPEDVADSIIDDVIISLTPLIEDTRWVAEAEADWWRIVGLPEPDYLQDLGSVAFATFVAAKSGLARLQHLLYYALLSSNKLVINELNHIRDGKGNTPSAKLVGSLFAHIKPSDFVCNVTSPIIASEALQAVGISRRLANSLLVWGILELKPDDAGLANAVQAAYQRISYGQAAPTPRSRGSGSSVETSVTREPTGETTPGTGGRSTEPKEGFSKMELARATVDFEQLRCHISKNWFYYNEAIWSREHPAQRYERLSQLAPIALSNILNEVIGFVGNHAIYPLINPDILEPIIPNYKEQIETIKTDMEEYNPVPRLVTMPTQGAALESIVGDCDACEHFIQQSRILDLRTQEAKTTQEEEEARRRKMKLDKSPPDLTSNYPSNGNVVVNIDNDDSTGGTSGPDNP